MLAPLERGPLVVWILGLAWVPWALAGRLGGAAADVWWVAAVLPLGLYVAALTAAALAWALLTRRGWPALAAAIGLVVVGLTLQGRATAEPQPTVAGGIPFTVLALNLDRGGADPAAVARLVREEGVDAAAFIELTPQSLTRLDRAGLGDLLPHRQAVPGAGAGGIGAFSRHPSTWDYALLPPDRPWMPAVIDVPGAGRVRFEALRSPPPRPKTAERFRIEDPLALLPAAPAGSAPLIVAGDLNASVDNHRLREFLARGYRDAASETGDGLTPTWSGLGGLAQLTLDHVLVSATVAVEQVDVVRIPGTDHRAVVARLVLPRG